MILTPLIDIDNLDPTNGIIYTFESLWSLMTKGERNKDKIDMPKEGDQLKFEANK